MFLLLRKASFLVILALDEEIDQTGEEFDSTNYKSFIHKKKKGKGKRKKMGQMTLSEDNNIKTSHIQKLREIRRAKLDKNNNEGINF